MAEPARVSYPGLHFTGVRAHEQMSIFQSALVCWFCVTERTQGVWGACRVRRQVMGWGANRGLFHFL